MSIGHLPNALVLEATGRTLALAGSVAALAGLFGGGLAWLLTRTDLSGSRVLGRLLSVPYALPAYLLGMAWVMLGNPTVGLLKHWLPTQGAYGFGGMTWVETSVAFAFPFLELRAAFDRLDPALEEAARMSGASPGQVFRDVSFPLLWPSWLNGICLAFLYAIASFGVPAILGLPVRQFVLTTLIYSQFKLGGAEGITTGLELSLILLGIAMIVLVGSMTWLRRLRRRSGAIGGAKSSRPSQVTLGRWKWPISALSWLWFTLVVIVPWVGLGLSALAPVAGDYRPNAWTLTHLMYVFGLSDFREALFNSALLAVTVSALLLCGSFLLAFAAVRRGSQAARLWIEFLGLPFASPGTVIAVLVIFVSTWTANGLGHLGISVDSPLLWMAVAYLIKHAAISARILVASFSQIHPALEEAARMSGARTVRLLWDIWVPLLRKSLWAAALLTALPILTELTMSVLLTGPGAATLGTVLFQLQEYADQPSAAALAWLLLTAALLAAFLSGDSNTAAETTP